MKSILTILAVILSFAVYAQSDTLYMHNGKKVTGNVKKVGEHTVSFTYQNEDVEQVLGKYTILKIIYAKSGRLQEITPKIRVKSEEDWENVIIVENLEEIAGLKRVDEIRGKSAFISYRTGAGADNKALKSLKKEAASMKCPFVLITSEQDRKYGQNQAIKRGIAYSYE
jgi:sRNA-binding regulator protein Hfq